MQEFARPIPQPGTQNGTPSIANAQTFTPHPALYGFVSGPAPRPPSPASPYQQLKELEQLLDLGQAKVHEAQHAYQKTLEQFATLCHQLWQQERAPGNREGKGFRSRLQEAGIKVGRAYRAMKKFFPTDFPSHRSRKNRVARPPSAVSSTSSAADKVANLPSLRFTGKLLPPRKQQKRNNKNEAREILECVFALTPKEKAEFLQCLKLVGARQVQHLLLEAVKQAADVIRAGQAQKENNGGSSPSSSNYQLTTLPSRQIFPALDNASGPSRRRKRSNLNKTSPEKSREALSRKLPP